MKKRILTVLLALAMLFAMVACSEDSSKSQENTSETTDMATTAMQGESKEAPNDASCKIYPLFYSIEDLDRYVTTGSLNLEDYKYAPNGNFSGIYSPELLQSQPYSSIYRFFDFEEDIFDCVRVSISLEKNGRYEYAYYLDDVWIIIQYVGTKATTLSTYAERRKISITADSSATLQSDTLVNNGYKTEKCGEFDVVYTMKDGEKRDASIVIDGFFILVLPCVEVSAYFDTEEQAYANFMTSPKYAAFSALFSDDPQTFEATVMGMAQPKGEVE